ncbi:MAG: dihydrofolate reductase [Treponema sp.]|nr:dihydrofolate reductase [Treponema sp.]MCL2237397.1 dihydrofolate reductase [Treponema sp.]
MEKRQEIIIIAAMAENGVIGKDNKLPWDIKGNLSHFKKMTMGCPCIMGRKTWESLPVKPLSGRLNIIVSETLNKEGRPPSSWREIKILNSLTSAVESCSNYEKIFIIGGESIYTQAMPIATKIDLTLIPGNYEGDAYFPKIDDSWEKTETKKCENFSIVTYIKKSREQK